MQFNRSLTDDQYRLHLHSRYLPRKILNTFAVLIGIEEDKWQKLLPLTTNLKAPHPVPVPIDCLVVVSAQLSSAPLKFQ